MAFNVSPSILLLVAVILLFCANEVAAFGAGNIPSYGYLEGKAFRHGDIEDTLAQLLISMGTGLSALFGRGSKFSPLNIKRVYFGNWLRDYSQAVDVGTLGRGIKLETIRILVWVMGFMAFGYATEEFEVTNERLGVYRPEEHIDNPRDYADNKDARQYDSRLRGPVDPRELQIDTRTAMKNYIANEQGGWTTSTQFIRQSLLRAIQLHRSARNDADIYESLRLLGQALHCLEDLPAHSNWIELALLEMGHRNVFPHVGSNTMLQLGGKWTYPLVTGTFGGMDFIHSLLGEAEDHLSQTQIEDVNTAVHNASLQSANNTAFNSLAGLLGQLPGQTGRELENECRGLQEQGRSRSMTIRDMEQRGGGDWNRTWQMQTGEMDPERIAREIYPILVFRDKVVKFIDNTLDKIPGLRSLTQKISDSLTIWVMSLLEPFVKPIVQLVLKNLNAGSDLVISERAQYEVFDNPNSTDPTHSMLSKDHFSCYLNEPAGQVAIVIIKHAVTQVVQAWSDPNTNPHQTIDNILTVFCHPSFLNVNNPVHMEMWGVVEKWLARMSESDKARMFEGLSKDGVRHGRHHDTQRKQYSSGGGGHQHSHSPLPFGGGSATGGGVGSYVQQAQQLYHGGVGGLVQNVAGQFTRRDIDEPPPAGNYGNVQYEQSQQTYYAQQGYPGANAEYFQQPSVSETSGGSRPGSGYGGGYAMEPAQEVGGYDRLPEPRWDTRPPSSHAYAPPPFPPPDKEFREGRYQDGEHHRQHPHHHQHQGPQHQDQ